MKRIAMVMVLAGLGTLGAVCELQAQTFRQRLEERFARPQAPPEPLPEPLPPPAAAPGTPVLGVQVAPVTVSSSRQFGLPVRQGALITHIEPGSPAHRAGLPLGGAIVALNGQRIDTPRDVVTFMRTVVPGQNVELSYYQRNRLFRKTIRLTRSATPPEVTNQPAPVPAAQPTPPPAAPSINSSNRQTVRLLPPPPAVEPTPKSSLCVNRLHCCNPKSLPCGTGSRCSRKSPRTVIVDQRTMIDDQIIQAPQLVRCLEYGLPPRFIAI